MPGIQHMLLQTVPKVFPNILDSLGTDFDTAATAHTVPMPTGVVAGEVLIVWFEASGNQTITETAGGWTKMSQITQGGNNTAAVFYRIAGASNTFTSSHNSARAAAIAFRIAGANGTVDGANAQGGATSSWNPPSVTSSTGTTQKYLAMVLGGSGTALNPYTPPSGYTNYTSVITGSTPHIFSAYRNAEVTTEDPAASTQSSSANYILYTLLVHPST